MYPCHCCGFVTLAEPLGSYEICEVCGWEDDEVQQCWPGYRGGANHESLCDAQAAFLRRVATDVQLTGGAYRHPAWRPLRPEECIDADDDPSRAPYVYYWDREAAG